MAVWQNIALILLLCILQVKSQGAQCKDEMSTKVCESMKEKNECADSSISSLAKYCKKTCGTCRTESDYELDEGTSSSPVMDISCDFELGPCGWVQDTGDDFNWTLNDGSTGTVLTGPLFDHTSGEGQYMFIETSLPRQKNDKATLNYKFAMPVREGCFSMYYHMYGGHVGTLTVSSEDVNGTVSKLWSESWRKADKWLLMSVTITRETSMISINGFVGDGIRGDIAIDDISFASSSCDNVFPTDAPAIEDPIG